MRKKVTVLLLVLISLSTPISAWALASNNIPLDSPVYLYIEKLAGFGLVRSDVKGIRPYSRAEAVRLYLEAEENLPALGGAETPLALELMQRLQELLPREVALLGEGDKAPLFKIDPVSRARVRYFYLDGTPRNYNRVAYDPGHQSAFGFIGGDLRPFSAGTALTSGTEGTPLLENNEGVIYHRGSNGDFRFDTEGYLGEQVSALVEPVLLLRPHDNSVKLEKGYLKLGGGGLELEVGRDANWFGPGFRGDTVLTNNAKNFDVVKISSPEPLDLAWLKRWVGDVKYSLLASRFNKTDAGTPAERQPWMLGAKLAVKPADWVELGANFARQAGGPGLSGSSDTWFGGGANDHSNTLAGFDLRLRVPSLRNTEFYVEYSGEDNAGGVWPFVESYVTGFYVPRLTASGKDDLRFEFFWGSVMLYADWEFPRGYVYHDMTPGHSQGTAAEDYFVRYSHWFSGRHNLALEYFHTERGQVGKLPEQSMEFKNAYRAYWTMPVYRDIDSSVMYAWEHIKNWNLVGGQQHDNQILKIDLSYKY
jgi:hypothetical protein